MRLFSQLQKEKHSLHPMNFITQQQGDCKVQFGEPGHKKRLKSAGLV